MFVKSAHDNRYGAGSRIITHDGDSQARVSSFLVSLLCPAAFCRPVLRPPPNIAGEGR